MQAVVRFINGYKPDILCYVNFGPAVIDIMVDNSMYTVQTTAIEAVNAFFSQQKKGKEQEQKSDPTFCTNWLSHEDLI